MNHMAPYLHNQRGIALLLTLVILVLLVALIVEFDYGTKIDLITAANFRNDVQASYIAKAGVHTAIKGSNRWMSIVWFWGCPLTGIA